MSHNLLKKTMASTLQKVADLPRYKHPADLINMEIRPIKQQRSEIDGILEFGVNKYYSAPQEKLVQNLIQTRQKYRKQSGENRLRIAETEYGLWSSYLDGLTSRMPQDQLILGQKRQKIYESFLIAKERNQEKMQLSKTVKLFYMLSKGFKFDIAFHPIVMIKMVNPHFGYLNNYTETRMAFDDYLSFLEEMIACSQFWYDGSTLHGSQVLSFIFWKAYADRPVMKLEQFCKFLKLFKFELNAENLDEKLGYHLKRREGEIQDSLIRFDLWRNVFLQRGL